MYIAATYSDGVNTLGTSAFGRLLPYCKNAQIFSCPSTKPTPSYTWAGLATITSAYMFNWYYYLDPLFQTENYGNYDPSRVCAFTEWNLGYHTTYFAWMATYGQFKHNDGQNVGYADGHAKWEARQTLIAGFDGYGYKK